MLRLLWFYAKKLALYSSGLDSACELRPGDGSVIQSTADSTVTTIPKRDVGVAAVSSSRS